MPLSDFHLMEEVIKFNCILEHGVSFPVHLINNSLIAFGAKENLKENVTRGSLGSPSFTISINYVFPKCGSLGHQSDSRWRANGTGCRQDEQESKVLRRTH